MELTQACLLLCFAVLTPKNIKTISMLWCSIVDALMLDARCSDALFSMLNAHTKHLLLALLDALMLRGPHSHQQFETWNSDLHRGCQMTNDQTEVLLWSTNIFFINIVSETVSNIFQTKELPERTETRGCLNHTTKDQPCYHTSPSINE